MENTTPIVEPEFGIYETYTKEQAVRVFETFFQTTDLEYSKTILWKMFHSSMYDPNLEGFPYPRQPIIDYAFHLEMITSVLSAAHTLYGKK